MNKIVFELCPEDRDRLDAIITGLARITGAEEAMPRVAEAVSSIAAAAPSATEAAAAFARTISETHPIDAPVEHFDPPASDPEPEPEVPVVSLGEFQKAIVVRCAASPEMKKKVQALIKKYAESVSLVPEEKRAEVLAALAEL